MTRPFGCKSASRLSWLLQGVSAGFLGLGLGWATLTLALSMWSGLQMLTTTNGLANSTGWSPAWLDWSVSAAESKPSIQSGCKDWSAESRSPKIYSSDLLTWRHSSATQTIFSVSE